MSESVKSILEADLARIGMTQEQFGERLGVTQQAISLWQSRNRIPRKRFEGIIEILGADSSIARYLQMQPGSMSPSIAKAPGYSATARPIRTNVQEPGSPTYFRDLRQQQEDEMLEVIQEYFSGVQLNRRVMIGPYSCAFDYISDTLVADVVAPHARPFGANATPIYNIATVPQKLWRLAVAKKVDPIKDRVYMLLAVMPGADPAGRDIERIKSEAKLFDILFVLVDTFPEAGQAIVDFELQSDDDGAGGISDSDGDGDDTIPSAHMNTNW